VAKCPVIFTLFYEKTKTCEERVDTTRYTVRIERAPLFLVLQTPGNEFKALFITKGNVRGILGSENHVEESCFFIYVNLNGLTLILAAWLQKGLPKHKTNDFLSNRS
jgi:hypothetical protein